MSTVQQQSSSAGNSELETVSASGSTEGTFQTINKRSSNQSGGGGRRGGSRDQGSVKGHQGHFPFTDETVQGGSIPPPPPPRKRVQSNHKDKDYKPRPSNQRPYVGQKDTSKSGGGAYHLTSKGKEFGHTYHHTNRHRNGPDGSGLPGKLGSKVTSNRFEKLDLDVEYKTSLGSSSSGENLNKSSSSSSTSLTSFVSSKVDEKKSGKSRTNRSGKQHSSRGRGPSHKQQSQESQDKESGYKSNEVRPYEMEEEEEEDGGGDGVNDMVKNEAPIQKKRSPKQIKFDLPPPEVGRCNEDTVESHENKIRRDDNTVVTKGVSTDDDLIEGASSSDELPETTTQPNQETSRIVYERESLLAMRDLPLSRTAPSHLTRRDILCSQVSMVSSHHTSDDLVTQSDFIEESSGEGRSKHPTALNLVREHDKLGRVSLSPQRRSFQRGCSWKDKMLNNADGGAQQNSSDTPLKTPPLKNDQHFKFDGQKSSRQYSQGPPQSPHSHNMPHPPRVIHHVPLHRQGKSSKEPHLSREPEPEWMEFGPTDRYDVIELKGFDEHEIKREALKDADSGLEESGSKESLVKDHSLKQSSSSSGGGGGGFFGMNGEDPYDELDNELLVDDKPVLKQKEDNEFILDGFDFSTGVSICQELALDEEEGGVVDGGGMMFSHEGVKDPSQLSNVLMKALGVGREKEPSEMKRGEPYPQKNGTSNNSTGRTINTIISAGAPPSNALTLDEIHARENIPHPPIPTTPTVTSSSSSSSSQAPVGGTTTVVGEGMGAFNKLLAAMKAKQQQDISHQKPSQQEDYTPSVYHSSQNYPNPTVVPPPTTATPTTNSPAMRMPERTMKQQQQYQQQHRQQQQQQHRHQHQQQEDYGYLLEMELLDLDEELAMPTVSAPFPDIPDRLMNVTEPNLVRLEKLSRMLDRMNRDPMATQYSNMTTPPTSLPPHHAHQIDGPMRPSPLDRDGRGWMYQDRSHDVRQQVDHPTPQQLMAARQHQMLTNTRSANNWAVEMERRRVLELQQMQLSKERERYTPLHHSMNTMKGGGSSKPNISLLPTAVMRQIHSSKPTQQQLSTELPKTSSMNSRMETRMDRDLTSKASQSHNLLNHDTDYSEYSLQPRPHGRPTAVRMGHPRGHAPPKMADVSSSGAMYYNGPVSHGMQVQNPYMF